MNRLLCVLTVVAAVISVSFSENADTVNNVEDDGRKSKSEDMLWDMLDTCVNSRVKSVSMCLKIEVLKHFDYDVSRVASSRSMSAKNDIEKIDRMLVKRFHRYVKSREFRIQLPEFFFQGATLVFDPKKGLTDFDVEFPKEPENEDRSMSAARDMMQQKALLPLLLLLKLKLKMITPIMLTLVSVKATKALVMSKLALLLVSVFMFSQVLKKLGMHLPMLHPPPMEMMPMSMSTPPTYGPPPPAYGAPSPPATSYGSPSQSASFSEPNTWDPSSSSSNSHSKIWDPQQIAYSAYYKTGSGSSSLSSSTSSS